MPFEKVCKWHGCGCAFTSEKRNSQYCSAECRLARAAWKQARGAVAIELLLGGKWKELSKMKIKLEEEINAALQS